LGVLLLRKEGKEGGGVRKGKEKENEKGDEREKENEREGRRAPNLHF